MVTQAITVRECEARDLERFDHLGGTHHQQYCREQFTRGRGALTILVAVDDADAPIGKVHLDFEERAAQGEAVLIAASVESPLRGRGIGTELMRAAETYACSRGFGSIVLGAEDFNPRARQLYERLGYRVVGAHDFKYEGAPDPNPGVWMRKELEC